MSQADLEILISKGNANRYDLTLRFRHAAARQDRRCNGSWTLDEIELLQCQLDPTAYGEQLAAQLLAGQEVRSFLDQALAVTASHKTPLHLRLFISAGAEALHGLRWEALRLPGRAAPLATGEWVRFSRYLDSDDWRPVHVPRRDALRALVAVASPDVTGTTLAEVRTEAELQAARTGLGAIPAVELATRGQVTLANLLAHLRDGCDILYLVAHGMLVEGEPQILLEQADGGRAWTSGRELAARLGELAQQPSLVALVSCQSAGSGHVRQDGGALAGLGPRLAAAGVPAVVAMQGNVSMDTAAAFMPVFLSELQRDGQVDRAMAVARGAVRERPDWWMPVLFTRLEDGRLFGLAEDAGDAALTLLASLPLDDIPPVSPALPPNSRLLLIPNLLFVGREDDLRTLARILHGGSTATVGQVAAVIGLGGIGKTQLAVEFAHRYGRFFAGGVFLLSCADPNSAPAEVAACGLAMGLPGFEELDLPGQVERVRRVWQEATPRLLIFDNCEEEELLAKWRPASGGCRVLVTSRRAAWSRGLNVKTLALPVLPRRESVALLRGFRDYPADDDPVLEEIAAELGDLPLALHLAGNFLDRYGDDVTPAAYLEQLRSPNLLAHRSMIAGDYSPTAHETHVARTFALSYDRLDSSDAVDALALALLARLACFAPGEPVARDLLLLTVDRNADGPNYEVTDALRRLAELGLVERQEGGGLVLHRLVAAFMETLPAAEEAQEAMEEALGREANRVNETRLPALLLPWQGHLRYVTDRALTRGDVQAAWLCNELGYHLYQAGDLRAARPYLEQSLNIRRQVSGEAHPDTATSLNNLGLLHKAMGDLPARTYHEQALAIRRQTLGEAHPDTATSLNNLGLLLKDMGELAAAKPYYEQALVIKRQTLGDAHPDTAISLNNLGSLLKAMGDLPTAKAYYEQALAIFRQALGEAHPSTAASLNNLGGLLQDMGDLPAAQACYEQALAMQRQALGEVHPHTAISLNNLGYLLQATGDLPAAKAYVEQALGIQRQTLGDAHPDIATSLNNLGMLLHDTGDLAAARPYYEQALAIRRQALGEDHPDTATSLNNLGRLLYAMGDLPATKANLEQALAVTRQVLGDAHPNTAASLNNLGSVLYAIGDLPAAKAYVEQALGIQRQTLGDAHPDTATSLDNLGLLLQAMGDLPAALAYLEQALAIRRQALGEDHPDTATSLNNLGRLLYAMGDLPATKAYLEQALAITRQVLGDAHPNTAASLNNLGSVLYAMGDLPTAKAYYEQALVITRQALGENHPDTASSLDNLGLLLQAMGDLPAALAYLEQALAIRRQALGEDHPDTATSLNNLGRLLYAMSDLPTAKAYYEQALVITRQALGENHPDTASSLDNLGLLLQAMGDLPAAQAYLEQALAIRRQALGEDHPDTAQSLNNIGTLLHDMGDLLAARPYLEQALAIRRQALGEDHPDTTASLNNLGWLLKAMGDLPAAKAYLEQAVAIAERSLGPNHPTTHIMRRNLQRLLDELETAAAPGERLA